ncbi:MAG: hypothetical protein ACREKL_14910, partial [Chthoniobacterales bacterium]
MIQPARLAALLLFALATRAPADATRYTVTDLNPFDSTQSTAYAINASGQVAGEYLDMSAAPRAFRYSA